jgi:gas vesicle protein
MNDTKKIIGGIFLGAIAGAALVLFLQSNKGKLFVEKTKETADDLGEKLNDNLTTAQTNFDTLIAKGKSFLEELEQKFQQNNT